MRALNSRAENKRVVGRLYRRHDCDLSVCFYCGDLRQGLDHVPPLSAVLNIGTEAIRAAGLRFLLVPACTQCNVMLGGRKLGRLDERAAFLLETYSKAISKFYSGWNGDEVDELGPGLRPMIAARFEYCQKLIKRLRGVEARLPAIAAESEILYTSPAVESVTG